jgi:hypothetical protein
VKFLLILILFVSNIVLASEWQMEDMRTMTDSCINKFIEEPGVLSNGEVLEYCACSIRNVTEKITIEEIVILYESGLYADKLIELEINKICTENLFY